MPSYGRKKSCHSCENRDTMTFLSFQNLLDAPQNRVTIMSL